MLSVIQLGMAIYIQPEDTRPGPTLMGRILPDPINYRVGYGFFFFFKPELGSGRVRVLCIPDSNPTRIHIIFIKKKFKTLVVYILSFPFRFHFSEQPNPHLSAAPPPSLSQALTVGHTPLTSDTPFTVMASLSFTASQPRFASRSPHDVTPPRHPLPLSPSLSFCLSRRSPSHVTFIHSPTHPSLSSRGGCCFKHESCGGWSLSQRSMGLLDQSTGVRLEHRIVILERDQMIGGQDCNFYLWFVFFFFFFDEWKICINKEEPKKQVDLCFYLCLGLWFVFFFFLWVKSLY